MTDSITLPLDLTLSLEGKVAVVTGGASGIGAAIAETYGRKGYVCDVSDVRSVEAAVSAIITAYGHIDILVNSAGIALLAPAEELAPSAFERTLAVNVTGTFLMSQAVGRHMLAASKGRIVNLASHAGSVALDEHV